MAEIFAITATVLAVGQLASSCVRMAKALVAVKDDKFDELYWRMEAEKGITIEWTKNLAAANYAPPREKEKQFSNLLHGLADRYRDLEAILNKVYPQGIPDRGISVRMTVLSRRLLFEFGRFEELKQTLNTISAMNDFLKQFSPPPAKIKYMSDSSIAAEPVEVGVGHHYTTRADTKQPGIQTDVSTQSRAVYSTSQQDNTHLSTKPPPVKPLPFSSVYYLGLQILERLAKVYPTSLPHYTSSNPVSRFQLWGTGLFQDKTAKFDAELDLKRLWATPAGQRHRRIGIFVMRTLISILISELLILEIVISELPEDSPHHKPLQKDKSKIQLILAEEDLADIVRDRFEEIFPSWDDFGSDPDWEADEEEETASTQATKKGWEDNVKDNPHSISSCVEDIEVSIHCLYTVLPSICACRQSHTLDLEAKKSAKAAESEQVSDASVSVTPQRTSPTDSSATNPPSSTRSTPATTPATSLNLEDHKEIIERNLRLAKELVTIFKSEEKFYRRNKKTIRKFSPKLEQEVKRLEDYYDALTKPDGRVVLTQQKFQAGLEQNHAGMEIIKLMYEPTTLSPKKTSDSLKSGDSKDSAALVQSVEEQIETMVKQFTTPTFHGLAQRNRGPLVVGA